MSKENHKIFSERLLDALSGAGLKPSELAAKLKTKPSTVGSWLSGRNSARPVTLRTIASVLNVSPAWLRGETEERGNFHPSSSESPTQSNPGAFAGHLNFTVEKSPDLKNWQPAFLFQSEEVNPQFFRLSVVK